MIKLDELLLNNDQRVNLVDQLQSLIFQRDKLNGVINMISAVIIASDMAESQVPLVDALNEYCNHKDRLQ